MKTKPLGRTGLELTPFGLLAEEGESAASPPGVPNWCDIPADLDKEIWQHATTCMTATPLIVVRVGPRQWDRTMLTACSELLERIERPSVDMWQLALLDVERVKAGEPFRMMIRLKELGQVRLFSVRVNSVADALWVVEHTPAHTVTLNAEYDEKTWSKLLTAADDAGAGVIGTTRTTGGDVARARDLLAHTSIASFSWPARLPY